MISDQKQDLSSEPDLVIEPEIHLISQPESDRVSDQEPDDLALEPELHLGVTAEARFGLGSGSNSCLRVKFGLRAGARFGLRTDPVSDSDMTSEREPVLVSEPKLHLVSQLHVVRDLKMETIWLPYIRKKNKRS